MHRLREEDSYPSPPSACSRSFNVACFSEATRRINSLAFDIKEDARGENSEWCWKYIEDCGPWRVPGGTYSNVSIAWYKTVIKERVVYLPWDDPFLLSGNNREPVLTLGWLVTGACNKSLWVDGPRREPHRSKTFRLSSITALIEGVPKVGKEGLIFEYCHVTGHN
jgi:hypothetical protein